MAEDRPSRDMLNRVDIEFLATLSTVGRLPFEVCDRNLRRSCQRLEDWGLAVIADGFAEAVPAANRIAPAPKES